jgi:hypothetical protein
MVLLCGNNNYSDLKQPQHDVRRSAVRETNGEEKKTRKSQWKEIGHTGERERVRNTTICLSKATKKKKKGKVSRHV